jgi:hypothetical protein
MSAFGTKRTLRDAERDPTQCTPGPLRVCYGLTRYDALS